MSLDRPANLECGGQAISVGVWTKTLQMNRIRCDILGLHHNAVETVHTDGS